MSTIVAPEKTGNQSPTDSLGTAAFTAMVHAGLILLWYAAVFATAALIEIPYQRFGLHFPRSTKTYFYIHSLTTQYPILALLSLAIFIAFDFWVLNKLIRLGLRQYHELWSILIAAMPTLLALLTVVAIIEPFTRLTMGLSKDIINKREEAVRQELTSMVGIWQPVSRMVGKQPIPINHTDKLVIHDNTDFQWTQDGVTTTGTIRLQFKQNPPGISFYGHGEAGWMGDRTGIFKHDGNRLTIAIGQLEAFGTALPNGFDDNRPEIEVVIFERVPHVKTDKK